ncbi:MAG: TCP-1/cpn60 chaperonin family protein [Candidatus Bathyarchaeota archaeon]|nr:MAG: TCP-1/cpn60 chaperonin family protein [Candidatus Bathyarchaeota archaeon]
MSSQPAGTPVLILREGASQSRGREAQRANMMAARIVAEAVKSALGPKGMDKMLVDSMGDVTITSDGRTVLDEMDIQHPAAKMMVEVAKTQDDEVGDGTTTSVITTGELLAKAEDLIEKRVHPTVIINGYRKAAEKALEALDKIAISVKPDDKDPLKRVAMTAMASKLVAENREYLAEIASSAILQVAEKVKDGYKVDIDDVKVEKKAGESLTDTKLISGVVVDKEVVHSGMPKRVENARIVLLDTALEIEKTEFDAKINIESPEQMDAFLKEEENMLRQMVEKIATKGADVVICQKGIDDLVQHFLSGKNIFALRRVKKSDMEKLAKATGGKIVTNLNDLTKADLGQAKRVEERKIGDDKMTFIEGCKNPRSVTILIRGGTERIVEEAERSLHDALCVVRDVIEEPKIVAGGGSPEMEVAKIIKDYAEMLPGREQLAAMRFAEALEAIPTTLAENAGLDPIDIISELRTRHEKGEVWAGVEVHEGKVRNMKQVNVFEPLAVKKQIIKSASEAACMILKIDDIIAAGKMKTPPTPPGGPGMGAGGMPPGMGAY